MKKGCILKFIIIFTIILAVSLYIVQNKFEEIFLDPGKKPLFSALEEIWENNLAASAVSSGPSLVDITGICLFTKVI